MLIYIPYSSDIYKADKNGSQKLVTKGLIRMSQIDMDQIDDITEYVNSKGKIEPKKALIIHRDLGTIIANMPVKELWAIRERSSKMVIKGFNIEANEKTRKKRVQPSRLCKTSGDKNTSKGIKKT